LLTLKFIENEQCLQQKLNIWVGSWNVGNSLPCDLDEMLSFGLSDYDIIAFGAQVCLLLSFFCLIWLWLSDFNQ
jgi:hypothetical protein